MNGDFLSHCEKDLFNKINKSKIKMLWIWCFTLLASLACFFSLEVGWMIYMTIFSILILVWINRRPICKLPLDANDFLKLKPHQQQCAYDLITGIIPPKEEYEFLRLC